ncbi:hypothetical protein MMC13_001930 [Lambiella insularis]|nr:hypothetical protein [Lambiella insularis]
MATKSTKMDVDVSVPVDPPTSPRKRRRRAPTTGAADDCFACQDRHTQCDRRRPYCTQCLDRGKDCSGYKTTLTWGVGVASRGKLRGLSLPIAKSKKVAPVEKDPPGKKSSTTSKSPTSAGASSQSGNNQSFTSPHSAIPTTFGFVNVDPNAATPSPGLSSPSFQWPVPHPPIRIDHTRRSAQRPSLKRALRRHSLEPLHVPAVPMQDYGVVPMTAAVFGGYGDQFDSAVECSPMTPGFNPLDMPMYKGEYLHAGVVASPMHGNFFTQHDIGTWPSDNMSSSLSSDQSSRDFREDDSFFADPVVANTLDNILGNQRMPAVQEFDGDELQVKVEDFSEDIQAGDGAFHISSHMGDGGISSALELSRSIPSLSIGNTPGLRFLINYYDKVISPVIVAFDGPTNPYRTHILQLAQESETLQHAIAALSASNLRMRREHNPSSATQPRLSLADTPHDNSVRKSSMAHTMLIDDLDHVADTKTLPGTPSKEELHHKGESIRTLNAQLADPSKRKDDSILATLLMLCLYHICDTGVAKFKTQFAGVKKILALRGEIGTNSKETAWLRTMFTWFDAMTATVNDREGQFDDCTIVSPLFPSSSTDDWVLENLAGCDARLFSTIARLGRLNLLSQGKAVSESPNITPKASPQPKTQDYYSMNYNRVDGNGWSPFPDDEMLSEHRDGRTEFWTEWADIRRRLQEWSLNSATLPRPMHTPSLADNRLDLLNISESFRYSALLYTERLAYPHTPSSAENFQRLVAQALYYISQVKSDVYLLWPLFITGTECVQETHRGLIRGRCLDIQKDSGFFNNISTLELLKKMWRDDDRKLLRDITVGSGACSMEHFEGFKWRRAMEKVDGEYIVI